MTDAPQKPGPMTQRVIMSRVVRRKEHQERSFDMEFWRKVGGAGRFAAAWQMIREVQLMRGQCGELPGMQRNVVRIIRRSRTE
ncbi:MAG: hypothetical protein H6Q07_3069 [Acidobacteria bacterium]|nr:hypothetical protein [Acidobacteriota bacterium]